MRPKAHSGMWSSLERGGITSAKLVRPDRCCALLGCVTRSRTICAYGPRRLQVAQRLVKAMSTFFVDYLRIDPHLDMDRMLQNRKGISAGYRMAGKYLAIIQPFSALLSNVKFRSRHSMHANMQPCLELLREWEACLMMEDIALTIRSSIALLESISSYVHMLPMPRSAHFLQWSDRRHELAELADEWTPLAT